ncbi:MAB_1171c family putative transporter [Streptomyces hygroscopicus]|uniref:MAB_1171c family putative transporter n=1 Tax=Streptomyces hygroscopicus TaxID=1912 RepID=UPI000825D1E4|nr:MAB_1171c family putative transporter [Streptomyces hygroscopicus]
MLLFNIVYGALAVISWSAFFYKLRDLIKEPRNRELRLLCLAVATFATPFVIASPWIYVRVDRALGVTNIATLFVYSSVAICVASFLALLVSWSLAQSRIKLWHRLLVAYAVITVASMVTLFSLGDVSDGEHHVDFDVHYAETSYIREFLLIYAVLYLVSMVALTFMCWRYAKVVDRPWLRRGLKTVTAGAVFGYGYGAPKVVSLTWDLFGTSPLHFVSVNVAPMCASASAWLFAVGFTMPVWGVGLDRPRERIALYHAYRHLRPLWAELTHTFPDVVLFPDLHPSAPHKALKEDDLNFLVSRTVIEIRDVQLALRSHYDPTVTEAARELCTARGLADDDIEAVAEAAQIKAALRAREAGDIQKDTADVPHDPAAGDMRVERDWLIRVAKAYQRSSLAEEAAAGPRTVVAGVNGS